MIDTLASPDTEAAIDEALVESFPASDPPPWTLGVSQEAEMKIRCRTVDSVLTEVEGVQRHIAQRAQEVFRARGGAVGHALEDWMKAERETIWRPALEVRRTRDAFVVEAAVAGIDPKQFDVQVTPTELVLSAHPKCLIQMDLICSTVLPASETARWAASSQLFSD